MPNSLHKSYFWLNYLSTLMAKQFSSIIYNNLKKIIITIIINFIALNLRKVFVVNDIVRKRVHVKSAPE